ncbi:unnamed protein product [Blepharisma stoltei]|uniref:Protein kinase domain-containing protein n=1 Tax=Blepharisma stoltei TaxID=1481888 RepID=A0AAU9JLW2_9CILI|nr:unnamed protein product [Blepharisma stoltei]
MEIFDAISNYLETKGLHRSAYLLRQTLSSSTLKLKDSESAKKLLSHILSSLKNKENQDLHTGIAPENEDVMENLMSRIISGPSVTKYQDMSKGFDSLLNLRAFHKMVKCAEQLFFENESQNQSSSLGENSKNVESSEEDLPRFGQGSSNNSAHEGQSTEMKSHPSQDEIFETSYAKEEPKETKSKEVSKVFEDEYEDDDDPGYDLYECNEEDLAYVSKQLAEKYNFPQRASCPKKPLKPKTPKNKPTGPNSLLPADLVFPPSDESLYPLECENVTYDCYHLKVIYDRERTGFEETKDFPVIIDSVIAGRYQVIEYLGSAAFSKALQCLDMLTKQLVCVKVIENNKDYVDQSIDEIKILRLINCNADPDTTHFLKVIDYFYHKEHLFIVTELLRDNLYEFSRYNREHEAEIYFNLGRLQKVTHQILTALEYVHSLHLIHCDLKPENILIKSYSRCEIKVIDFGSSCFTHDHLSSYVQSRSYRAPEVILGCRYDSKIDIWSLGCIVAELFTGNVLFQNESVQGLLARVMGIIGPFPEDVFRTGKLIKHFFTDDRILFKVVEEDREESFTPASSTTKIHLLVPKKSSLKARLRTDDEVFLDFVGKLLEIDRDFRPTAKEALEHPWFKVKYPDGL